MAGLTIPPLSVREDFSGDITVQGVDGRRLEGPEAEGVSFVLAILDDGCGCWPRGPGSERVRLETGSDDLALTNGVLSFAFPPGTPESLGPGAYCLSLVVQVESDAARKTLRSSEILLEPFTVTA